MRKRLGLVDAYGCIWLMSSMSLGVYVIAVVCGRMFTAARTSGKVIARHATWYRRSRNYSTGAMDGSGNERRRAGG